MKKFRKSKVYDLPDGESSWSLSAEERTVGYQIMEIIENEEPVRELDISYMLSSGEPTKEVRAKVRYLLAFFWCLKAIGLNQEMVGSEIITTVWLEKGLEV